MENSKTAEKSLAIKDGEVQTNQDLPSSPEEDALAVLRYKRTKTAALTFLALSFGISGGITGTTLLDLKDNIKEDVTMGQFSLAITFKNIGLMVGSLGGSLINDRFQNKSDLILASSTLLLAFTAILKPFVVYLASLAVVYFFDGVSSGSLGSVGMVTAIQLWGNEGDSAVQTVQTGFALGFTIAPLLAWPFVLEREAEDETLNDTLTTTQNYNISSDNVSQVHIPYICVAAIAAVAAGIFFVFYFVSVPASIYLMCPTKRSWKETVSPGSCAYGDSAFSLKIIGLSLIFFVTLYIAEILFDTYLYAVAVEGSLQFSSDEAVLLDFANKLTFLLGRTVAIPITYVFPVQPILHTITYSCALLSVLLAIVGVRSAIALWIISCSYTFLNGPTWGCGFSWMDKYIILYAVVIGIIDIGNGTCGFLFHILAGFLYTEYYPETIFYVIAGGSLAMALVLPIMQVVGSKHGNRFHIMGESCSKEVLSKMNESTKL